MRARELIMEEESPVLTAFRLALEDMSDNGWTIGELLVVNPRRVFVCKVSRDGDEIKIRVEVLYGGKILVRANGQHGRDTQEATLPEIGTTISSSISKLALMGEIETALVGSRFTRVGDGEFQYVGTHTRVWLRGHTGLPGGHVQVIIGGPGIDRSIVVTSAEEAMAQIRLVMGDRA